jgi:hypothetical protein
MRQAASKHGLMWTAFPALELIVPAVAEKPAAGISCERRFYFYKRIEGGDGLIEGGDEVLCACAFRSAVAGRGFLADGIHPSDRGYKAWGRHIGEAIVAELRRRWTLVLTRYEHQHNRVDEP